MSLNPTRLRLRPISDGVDFLGYIVRPFHLLVRRRVLGHLHEVLQKSQAVLVHPHANGTEYRFDVDALDTLQASFSSYLGHFRYAACHRLIQSIGVAHPWLKVYFGLRRKTLQLFRRDRLPKPGAVRTVQAQYQYQIS